MPAFRAVHSALPGSLISSVFARCVQMALPPEPGKSILVIGRAAPARARPGDPVAILIQENSAQAGGLPHLPGSNFNMALNAVAVEVAAAAPQRYGLSVPAGR
jgi:hypothetical protein